ncbi:Pectate lyase superfamily protein [Halorubrum xinjiangense]|uniref:Pectate lyase superfamily protein n=1 Tax=Halorubrum xinjiangense TaxID=261291 RepID=A0A1G7KLE1_9EURY|nr:glycosyl hydrolase family 28-related protein [Halorubrum xinjiangense]SDF38078.1 Pectate lyase superfamily protein [Halorubrum xinjiangense]
MNRSQLRRREFLGAVSAGCGAVAGCTGRHRGASDDDGVWNVASHGIEGDGNTAVGEAVHSLLDEVHDAGGGIVYFPPGRYLFDRTPLVGDDTILTGAGRATVFEGSRPGDITGKALLSNKGFDATGYNGAANWGVRNVRIDAPDSNGIMPAHAENVRLESIYGDAIHHHHIDIVSSKNVVVDGYWASRGGAGDSDAPLQVDAQQSGTTSNGVWSGTDTDLAADDGTPTRRCRITNFEIDPENGPQHGIHLHRGPHESIAITDGYISECRYTAIRSDPDELVTDLTIDRVSCLGNARGITLGHVDGGRSGLTVSDVTIETEDEETAAGSGLYAAGFNESGLSNVVVTGEFTNSIIFDEMTDLKMSNVTATGATDQAFRFRENVEATLTNARAEDCGGAGIYSGPGSSVAYGGVTFENVGSEVAADGEIREWASSTSS